MQPVYEDTLLDGGVSQDGYYRVEITCQDAPDGARYFAWSNPVFVKIR